MACLVLSPDIALAGKPIPDVPNVYHVLLPSCVPGDGKPAAQWRTRAMEIRAQDADPAADMYLCAIHSARAGDRNGQWLLGDLYSGPVSIHPLGVQAARIYDIDAALYWLGKAADAGDADAAAEMGRSMSLMEPFKTMQRLSNGISERWTSAWEA